MPKKVTKASAHMVGICLSRLHAESELNTYQALHAQLKSHGYHLLVFNTSVNLYDHDAYCIGEESVFSLVPFSLLEALIILPETLKQDHVVDSLISRAQAAHVPVITINKPLEGCYNISFSYANSMEALVRHVVEEHGCTRVNFIAGMRGNAFSEDRLNAYKKVLTEHHIPIEEERIGYGDFWDQPTYQVMEDFFDSPLEFPEAIVCANDAMAIAVCTKLTERGYQIPEDVIVTGFDGIDSERYHTPRLTTARININGAAQLVVDILKQLQAKKVIPTTYQVENELIYSQSCGCKAKSVTNANARVLSLYTHMESITEFSHQMSRMSASLTGLTFDKAIYKLRYYIDMLNLPTASIYAAENYLSTSMQTHHTGEMTSTAITILNKRDGTYTEDRQVFPVTDLAPDLSELLSKPDTLLIMPIHFQEMVQAYMLIQLPDDFTDFTQLYMLHINLNQIMGLLHSQHSLRAALADMEYLYSHDYMTALYNRRGFYTRINELVDGAARSGQYLAVYSIDLNGLKYINDTYGHQEGDFAILQTAKALESAAPKESLCSRFGGDEFTVAMIVPDAAISIAYRNRVEQYLAHINQTENKPYIMSASFGLSFCVPDRDFSFDKLILQADEKMYLEKEQSPYSRDGNLKKETRGRKPRP
jgi:diguanylate cyclase (GGDEF)-like protein